MKWIRTMQKLLVFEQMLFGLPLALIGALLPFANEEFLKNYPWSDWGRWFWIFIAFSAARSAGMAFNRLIDKDIDALNPRTKDRPLPRGEISYFQVAAVAWGSIALFLFSCSMLNTLCFLFSPLIAFLICAYSYTKRFTALCHFVLGLIEFFAPFLGWVAITGTWDWPPILLGSGVLLWISGMDVIYSTQDESFDRQYRLHSIPVLLGRKKSLLLAQLLHVGAVLLFAGAGFFAHVSAIYYLGLVVISAIFIYQHLLVKSKDSRNMKRAFFTCNGLIAVTQCIFTVGAILWDVSL